MHSIADSRCVDGDDARQTEVPNMLRCGERRNECSGGAVDYVAFETRMLDMIAGDDSPWMGT